MTSTTDHQIVYKDKLFGARGIVFVNLEDERITISEPEEGGRTEMIEMGFDDMRKLAIALIDVELLIKSTKGE